VAVECALPNSGCLADSAKRRFGIGGQGLSCHLKYAITIGTGVCSQSILFYSHIAS